MLVSPDLGTPNICETKTFDDFRSLDAAGFGAALIVSFEICVATQAGLLEVLKSAPSCDRLSLAAYSSWLSGIPAVCWLEVVSMSSLACRMHRLAQSRTRQRCACWLVTGG